MFLASLDASSEPSGNQRCRSFSHLLLTYHHDPEEDDEVRAEEEDEEAAVDVLDVRLGLHGRTLVAELLLAGVLVVRALDEGRRHPDGHRYERPHCE